ncbi:MAG TPA: L-threonylcarbamoyladenylate synthase [Aggregatilineaceae bacterium]|nr:L-threonylcarbamoyladenylate synthase [Aggregatilineaceae bacterium]
MAKIISIEFPEAAILAAEVLCAGELIVLPTDTVYGVGARIDADAINRIFAAKQRPPEKAIPVLVADVDGVELVAREFPDAARRLADAFWPGPLTLALPKRDGLPANLSQLDTVGVRVPDHEGARAVIQAAGGALAVTSANRSEEPPACSIQEAIGYLVDRVALYLDGGPCSGGVPSTVVTFEGETPRILRVGPISESQIWATAAKKL